MSERLELMKPGRGYQSTWLRPEVLHRAPSARVCESDGKPGAQLDSPGGGSLTWVKCPHADLKDVRKVDGLWYWVLEAAPSAAPELKWNDPECPASGQDHNYSGRGPNDEVQCEYCGNAAPTMKVWVGDKTELRRYSHQMWGPVVGVKVPDHDPNCEKVLYQIGSDIPIIVRTTK
jgi:hypothetical protein